MSTLVHLSTAGSVPAFDKDGHEDSGELPLVTPSDTSSEATDDAIVLLAGNDLSAFTNADEWKADDGYVVSGGKEQFIESKAAFGDCQLHLEFATPEKTSGDGLKRCNSGIYFMGMYEVQILDSYENSAASNLQCGALFQQRPPLVNASRKPGQWQSYDIAFTAPRFGKDGVLTSPARATVFQNGVLVQNNSPFEGPTDLGAKSEYTSHASLLPLRIQNPACSVMFRNIWLRPATSSGSTEKEAVVSNDGWSDLLDKDLKLWEKFLGVPHPSVDGLPEGTPTSKNFRYGTTLGQNDCLDVFTATETEGEPVVRISVEVYGALTTKEEYSNYQLQLQFKWGNKKYHPRLKLPMDSGLLYHCVGKHGAYASSWMTSLECQIMERDYGDLFCLGDCSARVRVNPKDATAYRPIFRPTGKFHRRKIVRRLADYGNPTQWNTIDLYVYEDQSIHVINGKPVMGLTDARLGQTDDGTAMTKGKIQIQSEGAELFVRRVRIKSIDGLPTNLAEATGLK